ncbi:DUF3408 domain-containing protein [Fibrella sp. HMF5335]|uniref:DUF3408 domain-containing protein n=1 Tax=Fibrella rubiginis TaxID=2817060 RepID=A0A939K4Q3_9BACT|nr:DUF3408 domain-containing protein [Fibrella rubiginis]MBO0936431.1 DUF3408 domain-containing protein [Fibrella rubiginis]
MAKKTNKGAADDIALMASAAMGSDLDAWLNQQGISGEEDKGVVAVTNQPEARQETKNAPAASAEEIKAEPTPAKLKEEPSLEAQSPEEGAITGTATGKTGKQRERYQTQFFQRIEGFKKPTNMMYMSEKTYKLLAFLLRCSKEANTKVTMPEIMENIISQHIKDNEGVITQMQKEHLERLSKGF